MSDKFMYSLIAVLLFALVGVGVYAMVTHPQDSAALPADAAAAVTDAVSEVTGDADAPATSATTSDTLAAPADANPGTYTMAQVQAHNTASNCYAVVNGSVYDLTKWISRHPGGRDAIISLCGTDGSAAFDDQHGGQRRPASELAGFKIGDLAK